MEEPKNNGNRFTRRDFLQAGLFTVGVAATAAAARRDGPGTETLSEAGHTGHSLETLMPHSSHDDASGTVGEVDLARFDPTRFLTQFDWGRESTLPDGRTLREWDIVAGDKEVEVAPGVWFPAWTYNGQVPGPTFRCNAGDRLRFSFLNGGSHPHTIHFHGIHPPSMDGITPALHPGERFTYEFDAQPFGLHLYHCHSVPLKRHIHKGLYGTFIIDPPGGRAPANEMVMVMNAFDTNFDGGNEIYAVNTVAFHYARHPIQVKVGELVRVYLVNITEFDLINSLHLHAGMFRLYRTGTRLDQYEYTDTVLMAQGERHILEFTLENPGLHMYHAHVSEFAELGWMGFFEAS